MNKSNIFKSFTLIAVVTALVVGALLGVSNIGTKMVAQFTPLNHAAMVIKYRSSRFHLGIEELVASAVGANKEETSKQIELAELYARAMLDGGESPEGEIIPLEDERLRNLVQEVLIAIETLKLSANRRLQSPSSNEPAFGPYSDFHANYEFVLSKADEIEVTLNAFIQMRLEKFHLLIKMIVGGVLIFAGAVALVVYRYEKGRDETEYQLMEAKARAEEANRAKSEFLAAMSHDLRTPLNAIMGFAEMMATKVFGPLGNSHYEEYAQDIHVSGKHLVSLINGILDLSKIEAGKYKLQDEPIEVPSFVNKCIHMINKQAEDRKISITAEQQCSLPLLRADDRALGQILNNLISNAIKFSNVGGTINISSFLANEGGLCIKVADTGIGMSKNDIAQALEPFEQIDSTISRKHEGTGLGLYISSNLTHLHGGTMDIHSELDKGTVVTVNFPPERIIFEPSPS